MARRHIRLVAAAGITAMIWAGAGLAGAVTRTTVPPLRFSHEVIVDQQRTGFEPDVAVDSQDRTYTSVPNGSSTTTSWIWQSTDHANSYHLIPGSAFGRSLTCLQGGGDTELQLDKKDDIFMSDLQNLTNLTNSVSTDAGKTFTSSCAGAPNTPVDRMWYAIQGNLGDPDFRIYEDYDAVDSGIQPGQGLNGLFENQLVETVSTDGVTFVPVVNSNPSASECGGPAIYNCVTNDEGISGNQILAPNGDIMIAHTGPNIALTLGSGRVYVARGHVSGSFPAVSATWKETLLDGDLCPNFPVDNAHLGQTEICGAANFATIAKDTAGHFYVAFSSQPFTDEMLNGSPTLVSSGPYNTYVVTSLDGDHWSKPVRVSTGGSNAFSWVTAGASGRAAVAWYHANETHEKPESASAADALLTSQLGAPDPHGYTFDNLKHAEFTVQVGESLDALSTHPTWQVADVTEKPMKYGPICTAGTVCEVTQGDRSLGDFLEVNHDARGALIFSFVDDTSGYYSVGPTGAVADHGPPVIVRQIGGPSLLGGSIGLSRAGVVSGLINGPADGPGVAVTSVADTLNDAISYSAGQTLSAGGNLDLTDVALSSDKASLIITMRVADLSSLMVSPTAGGSTGEWITRFTTYDPGTDGNGHIYYAGMESVAGGTPRFFAGEPTLIRYWANYDSATTVPGTVDATHGTITIHLPFSVMGNHGPGTRLYSVTAFTATAPGSLQGAPMLFNVTDSTTPINYDIPALVAQRPASRGSHGTSNGSTRVLGERQTLPSTGLDEPLLMVIGVAMLAAAERLRRILKPR